MMFAVCLSFALLLTFVNDSLSHPGSPPPWAQPGFPGMMGNMPPPPSGSFPFSGLPPPPGFPMNAPPPGMFPGSSPSSFPPPGSCFCGDPRMGGQYEKHKWFESVSTTDANGKKESCFAVMVSDRHYLTAKDCVTNKKTVTLQKQFMTDGSEGHAIKRIVSLKSPASNVAVIELKTPLNFNGTYSPICLPNFGKEGRLHLKYHIKEKEDVVEVDNAFSEMEKVTGLTNLSPKTHLVIRKGSEETGGCARRPSTQLYSQANPMAPVYSVGVMHVSASERFCDSHDTNNILVDNLAAYQTFFNSLFKNAKTCPPLFPPPRTG